MSARSMIKPGFLADRLVPLLLAAGAVGVLLPSYGMAIGSWSLVWLATLVLAVGVTLDASDFVVAVRRPSLLLLAIGLPTLVLLPLSVVLARLWQGPATFGLLAIGSAPIEVSAVLLTAIALGDAALATTAVCISLLLAPLIVPGAFALAGVPAAIPPGDLLLELGAGVALPLVAGLGIRSASSPALRAGFAAYGADLGSAALALLLFGAGAAVWGAATGNSLDSRSYAVAGVGIFVALLVPLALGAATAAALKLPTASRAAVTFTCGMREFGVATAVAQIAVPAAAAVPALYGILLMVLASILARTIRRSAQPASHPNPSATPS